VQSCCPPRSACKSAQLKACGESVGVFYYRVANVGGRTWTGRVNTAQLMRGSCVARLIGLFLIVWMCVLVCGDCTAGFYTLSNTGTIEILDSPNPPTRSKPYPSIITVSNLLGCTIDKLTITIHGFSHAFPSDVTVLLVGPQGQRAILMAQVGGQTRLSVTNLTLTFDDDAADPLPVHTNLQSGVFKPTNGYLAFGRTGLPYDLPAPAPAASSNAPATLGVFNGTDPSGPWSLFVVDDSGSDFGEIKGGWTLNMVVSGPLRIGIGNAQVVISWPVQVRDCVLQLSPDLASPNSWTDWPAVPFESAGWLYVTNSVTADMLFYRLKYLTH